MTARQDHGHGDVRARRAWSRNDDLAQLMDTSDEWIRQRSGIHERHYVEPGQKPSELAQVAVAARARGRRPRAARHRLHRARHALARGRLPGHVVLPAGPARRSARRPASTCARSAAASSTRWRSRTRSCAAASTGACSSSAARSTRRASTSRTEGREVAVLFGDGAGAVVVEANDDPDDPARDPRGAAARRRASTRTSSGSRRPARASSPRASPTS